MWALTMLLEHGALCQQARYERFMARMMFWLAGGKHIDTDATEGFEAQVEAVYANPFEKKKEQPMTAEEIKLHVLRLLGWRENDGSDDAGCEADAG